MRPSGIISTNFARPSSVIPLRIIAVSAAPGATLLTVIPYGASERASPRLIDTIPPLLAA